MSGLFALGSTIGSLKDLFFNAPTVAFRILVISSVLINVLRMAYEYDSCSALHESGRWRGDVWDPYGCMPFDYGAKTVNQCFATSQRDVVFAGDMRAFEAYKATALIANPEFDESSVDIQNDFEMKIGETEGKLIWISEQYLLEESKLRTQLLKWRGEGQDCRVGMVVYSNGLAEVAKGQRKDANQYLKLLDSMIQTLSELGASGKIKVIVLPVGPIQDTILHNRDTKEVTKVVLPAPFSKVSGSILDAYEGILRQITHAHSNVRLLSVANTMVKAWPDEDHRFQQNGVYFNPELQKTAANLIVNRYCNAFIAPTIKPPRITCCTPHPQMNVKQKLLAAFFVVVSIIYTLMWIRGKDMAVVSDAEGGTTHTTKQTKAGILLSNLTLLGTLLLFIYLCDRTNLFLTERKWYNTLAFALPVCCCAVIAIATKMKAHTPTFLNRDQSDEWKGWMQLMFLIYHYTWASAVLPIYVIIRIFVGSYVWLSGYGHFFFFYKKSNFGLNRMAQVLIRINFMPFWLVLVMDKPLMFYYFCPLISFWFFFVYFSMFIMSNRNASHPFMTKKFVCIFAFVLLFWVRFLPGDKSLFDLMFDYPSPLYYLIQENGSVAEWAFRSSLDKYAVPCGMLTAYVYIRLSSSGDIRDGSRNDNLFKSGTVNAVAAVGSVVLLGAYTMFATTCVDKKECNSWHTVASPLMIGSFVLLRNVYGPFRGVVSRFFCFMGKISLELFLLQCHVWLGSDTKGLLVIIPGAPVLNVVVTSLVFLYVSILMHDITGAIAGVLLPSNLEGRALYMRVGGFVALCVGLYLL